LNRPAPISPAGGNAGDPGRPDSTPSAWSSSTKPGSGPTWRRCAAGAQGQAPARLAAHGHWRTLTILGALRLDRLTALCVFDEPINGQCFQAYVEQQLLPGSNPATSS